MEVDAEAAEYTKACVLAYRFKHFRLTIQFRCDADIWISCWLYQKVLRKQSVIIVLKPADHTVVAHRGLAASCRHLRCSCIKFDDQYYREDPTQLLATKAVIENEGEPEDLISRFKALNVGILRELRNATIAGQTPFRHAHNPLIQKLADALFANNSTLFNSSVKELQEGASDWLNAWTTHRKNHARTIRENAQKQLLYAEEVDSKAEEFEAKVKNNLAKLHRDQDENSL